MRGASAQRVRLVRQRFRDSYERFMPDMETRTSFSRGQGKQCQLSGIGKVRETFLPLRSDSLLAKIFEIFSYANGYNNTSPSFYSLLVRI